MSIQINKINRNGKSALKIAALAAKGEFRQKPILEFAKGVLEVKGGVKFDADPDRKMPEALKVWAPWKSKARSRWRST